MSLIFDLNFYFGIVVGGLLSVLYFSLSGSKLNWRIKK